MIKETYILKRKETALNVVQTNIESVRNKDITRTGLRIYDNGLIGVAGKIGKVDEDKLSADAKEALKQNISYPYEISVDRKEELIFDCDIHSSNDFINEMEAILYHLRENYPDFSFANKARMVNKIIQLKNDKNLDLYYQDKYISIELLYKTKDSINLMDGGIFYSGRKYDRKQILDFWDQILNAHKNIMTLPKEGTYPVVFWEQMAYGLGFSKLIQDLDGLSFGSKTSLLSEKAGQKAFNNDFTLYQSLHPDDNQGTPFFDAEGVVNKDYRYTLIENGTVITPYTDKKTAKMFNLPLTGSAGASYDSIPSLCPVGFKIKEFTKTVKELLGGQQGIFIMLSIGGDFTPKGDFAAPVQVAFFFDGENFIGRLTDIQISSNMFDMFGKDYRGLSKNSLLPDLSNEKLLVMDMRASKIK